MAERRSRVLVTGGYGVVGSWLCRELIRRRVDVVVWDLRLSPTIAFAECAGVEVVQGDLRDPGLVARVLRERRIDRIVHLAAIVGHPAEREPVLAIETNVLATASVLAAAEAADVRRVVAMSTKGVLGALPARYLHPRYDPVPVDLPTSPTTIYEITKAVVESQVRQSRDRGLSALAVRLATTWGPGKSAVSHAGFSLHSDVAAAAVTGRSTQLDIAPEQGHDLIFYADAASGLASAALIGSEPPLPVYHLGGGRIVTLAEFAAAVERSFPGVRVTLGSGPAPGRNCLMDIGPARRDLGFEPRIDVEGALADPAWRRAGEIALS